MAITITATQGGVTSNGLLLHVFVLTGAAVAASQTGNSNSTQFASTATWTASITNSTGSNIYQAAVPSAASLTLTNSNMTLVDQVSDATHARTYVTGHVTGLASGTTTRGFTINLAESGASVLLEILASGTIAEDGSAPAVASTTAATTVTTASFSPPGGSLLVALVSSNGGAGVTSMTVSGGGLTWTEKVKNNPSGGRYAGVWIADNPVPNGTVQPKATVPVPRRTATRGVWGTPVRGPAFVSVQSSGFMVIRRVPGSAVWGGYAATSSIAPILPGQIQSSGSVIIRRVTGGGGVFGGYAAISNIPAAPPAGPPPAIPTSGGTTSPWIRTFRAIAPGDIPEAGAALPKLHGRGYIGAAPGHVEDVIHDPWPVDVPSVPPLPGLLDAIGQAASTAYAASSKAVELGRIFADPPYERQPKKCGAIRKVGGVMLTCGRKPGHNGKHSDRGLDWR